PDPIVLRAAGQLFVFAVADAHLPLDAREVDAPLLAGGGTAFAAALAEGRPRKGDLQAPAAVAVARIVDRAVDGHGGLQAGDLPAVVGVSAEAVGLGQKEVPAGVERVHFE